jgi:secondary thiamine-phosphate synthase enzyme
MKQVHGSIQVRTAGRGLHPCQREVERWLSAQARPGPEGGLLTLFIQHTSASLLVQENADPAVCTDLDRWLSRLVRDGDPLFEHTSEGPDDMPAHVRSALTQVQLSIPVVGGGRMALGTWQGLYVFEHRHGGQLRTIALHYLGD